MLAELKPYCHHSGENDYMEVTVWSNGEAVDVSIDRKWSGAGTERFSLTYGEWELLQVLMLYQGD